MPRRLFPILLACCALLPVPGTCPAAAEGTVVPATLELATFAGGCFWCMEPPFDALDGVLGTTSGYTGGHKPQPSYREVSAGTTGHVEAVQITFDPSRLSYGKLLEVYWRNIDPTRDDGQFCDPGAQYRPVIYYHNDDQQRLAEESEAAIEKTKRFPEPIRVEIRPAAAFYPAEETHQDYYRKNPLRYRVYRFGCGRDRRLDELWGAAAH